MEKEKRLLFARNIFVIIVFTLLGIIVVIEKGHEIKKNKVEKEINHYFETNYKEIEKDLEKEKITYNKNTYSMKITSKINKNLYFYIKKKNKKIIDTYQEDYLEGNTLLKTFSKKLEKEIQEKTNTKPTIEITTTLDQFITSTQEKILKEKDLISLRFYTLKTELLINDWTKETITNKIIETINIYEEKEINPKNYTIIITNRNKIIESIEIKNLTTSFIENTSNQKMIEDIINNQNSQILKENNITYKYLNEEE